MVLPFSIIIALIFGAT